MYLGGLCFITDSHSCSLSFADMTLKVLGAGVRWVQYRDKVNSRTNGLRRSNETQDYYQGS